MSAATLDQLWHRIQKIQFGDGSEYEEDVEIRDYLTEKAVKWLTLTRQWRETLGLPADSYFTLAQDLVARHGSLQLPHEIGEWLRAWYKDPPMDWRGKRQALALIEGSLLWKLSEGNNLLNGHDIHNPYEPILDFFDWGGWIFHEHGTITDFFPTRVRIMLNAGIRESVYNTVYRDYWESLSKNQKKNKNRSIRNLK